MKKKILVHIAILLILTGGFCNVYIKGLSVSSGRNQLSAFAADDTYSWESVSKDDLVTAFKYYCKSRNLAIEGSVADAVTSFTTSTFNNICNTLGIDSTALQAELKKTTGGNLGLRFLFTQTGVNAYNRIFAEFLQNNDLNVGDEVDDEVLQSYQTFSDDDGNTCSIYVVNQSTSGSSNLIISQKNKNLILQYGSYFKYSESDLYSLVPSVNQADSFYNFTFNINSVVYKGGITGVRNSNGAYSADYNNSSSQNLIQSQYLGFAHIQADYGYPTVQQNTSMLTTYDRYSSFSVPSFNINGYPAVFKSSDNNYYIGVVGLNTGYVTYDSSLFSFRGVRINNTSDKTGTGNITVTTNNNTINNNTYNNYYTIIYNDGDYYDYDDDDEPDPSTPPGGGGGGGGDDPDPDDPPIVDPTPTPEPSIPDWDIELPEMPVGNEWLLYGLEKKFPWDIPFNLMYMLSLFAADPETPHFQGTLDLKVVQWNYDIDLAPFDEIARNVRNFEFVGFIIGLMLLTRKLIWG